MVTDVEICNFADNLSVIVWSYIKLVLYTAVLYVSIHVLTSHAIVHACHRVQAKPKTINFELIILSIKIPSLSFFE
jgi:hypothetical protein